VLVQWGDQDALERILKISNNVVIPKPDAGATINTYV
jgi:hypothetical protein